MRWSISGLGNSYNMLLSAAGVTEHATLHALKALVSPLWCLLQALMGVMCSI